MDPTLLGTLISAAVSILSVLIYHKTIGPPAAPGAPAAPASPSAPVQAPALPPIPSSDPFAGLPGLPGHPVLNVIFPWLTQALAPHPAAAVAAAAAAGEPAAIALLAHAVKQSPTAKAQMQALLG